MESDVLVVSPGGVRENVVTVPGDKSISHRALIVSALAEGNTEIHGILNSEDILRTSNALQRLGVGISTASGKNARQVVIVQGVGLQGLKACSRAIDCGNSGTSMRLLSGVLAAQKFASELHGDESLNKRPMQRVAEPLRRMGANIRLSANKTAPVRITACQGLRGIDYTMPVASAQVKSAILFAGLYANSKTTVIEPDICRDHTERMLARFGTRVVRDDHVVSLSESGTLRSPGRIDVPGDLSSAAAFLVLAAINQVSLTVFNVGINPTRDGVLHLLRRMGAKLQLAETPQQASAEPVADITASAGALAGIEISAKDVAHAIDELPLLMIAAACAKGTTAIKGAQELKVKESNRLAAMVTGLRALGITLETTDDGVVIEGGKLRGGKVDSKGDHRVAMAFAVAGTVASEPVCITHSRNIVTSYPGFVADMRSTGAQVRESASP